jgi:hypothetical protein
MFEHTEGMLSIGSVFPRQDQRIVGGWGPFVACRGSRGDEVVRLRRRERMARMKRFILSGCWLKCLQKDFVLLRVGEKCLHVRNIRVETQILMLASIEQSSHHLAGQSADKMPVTFV